MAEAVKKSGAQFFRGGAFKPRTSPYSFSGLGKDALKILGEIREQFGLKIVTEGLDEATVDLVEKYADMIQIGSRNCLPVVLVPPGTATIQSSTNFLRPVRDGYVEAVSRPLKVGRTVIVVETEIVDAEGRAVAHVAQSQAVLLELADSS